MQKLFKKINKKVNGMIITLVCTGIILLITAFLIVYTDFVLRLVMGFIAIVIAYTFFYGAYKIWHLKKEIDKYIKLL